MSAAWGRPASRAISGFRNRFEQTRLATGLPGRPITRVAPSRPNISGLPGRMAIFQKSSCMPLAVSTAWTRSWSPTEAPPSVTMMSALACRARAPMRADISSLRSRTMPRSTASAPGGTGDRGDAIGVGGDDLAGTGRAARRQQFVAGRDDGDQRPANDGERRCGWRRPPATAPRHRARGAGRAAMSPCLKSSPARADVAAGSDGLDRPRRSRRRCGAHSPG